MSSETRNFDPGMVANYRARFREEEEVKELEAVKDPLEYWVGRLSNEWEVLVDQSGLAPAEAANLMDFGTFDVVAFEKRKQDYVNELILLRARELTKSVPVRYVGFVILPPDPNKRPIPKNEDEGAPKRESHPRDVYLEQLLDKMDLHYRVYETSPVILERFVREKRPYNKEFYRAYVIDERRAIVLVNNGANNSTYILHDVTFEQWKSHAAELGKSGLSSFFLNNAIAIDWTEDPDKWQGTVRFFLESKGPRYLSYSELKASVQSTGGVTGSATYGKEKADHSNWPSNLPGHYAGEWEGWDVFLGRKKRLSLKVLLADRSLLLEVSKILKRTKIRANTTSSGVNILNFEGFAKCNTLAFLNNAVKDLKSEYNLPEGSITKKDALHFILILAEKGEEAAKSFAESQSQKKYLRLEDLYNNQELCAAVWRAIENLPVGHDKNNPVMISFAGYRSTTAHAFLMLVSYYLKKELELKKSLGLQTIKEFVRQLAISGKEGGLAYINKELDIKKISSEEIFTNEKLRANLVFVLEKHKVGNDSMFSFPGYGEINVENILVNAAYFLRQKYGKKISKAAARDFIIKFHQGGWKLAEQLLAG